MFGETIVKLADGCTLRSGDTTGEFAAGEYVRLCDPDGHEVAYWYNDEWENDPVLVMGAIMRCASGVRLDSANRK